MKLKYRLITGAGGVLAATAIILYVGTLGLWSSANLPAKSRVAPRQTKTYEEFSRPLEYSRVLLVHSYHPEYPWVQSITEGVKSVLNEEGVKLEIFYMDTKRNTGEAWKKRAGELARKKADEFRPDVIIAADDNAQEYFAKYYVDGAQPIVFCGVNADPSQYGYPCPNITGIIERPHFAKTMELAGKLVPQTRIAVLSSKDPTSAGALQFMKQEFLEVEVSEWDLVTDFEDWKKTVENCGDNADGIAIYMYHTLTSGSGQSIVEPSEVMKWTVENSPVPVFGFFDFTIRDGALAGVVESGQEHGRRAAEYALEIMLGTPIARLPITKANVGTRMVNMTTAERLKIAPSREALQGCLVVR